MKENKGGGDCLFRSMAQNIYDDESRHRAIRRDVCNYYKKFDMQASYPEDSLEYKLQITLICEEFDSNGLRIDESTGEGFVSSNRAGGKGSDDIYYVKTLKPICDVLVSVIVDNSENGNFVSGAVVAMSDDQGNVMGTKNTSFEGNAEFMISCESPTIIEVVAEGFESTKINVAGSTEEEVAVSVNLKPIDDIIEAGKVVLNPIYFDFDKSNITKQAAFELDKLVQLMKKYSKMGIAITSHTDKRGRASYNLKLSDERAKTTAQYLISQGIDSSRVTAEGKGETEQIIDCVKVLCSKEDYEKNRRSEFTIIDLTKE